MNDSKTGNGDHNEKAESHWTIVVIFIVIVMVVFLISAGVILYKRQKNKEGNIYIYDCKKQMTNNMVLKHIMHDRIKCFHTIWCTYYKEMRIEQKEIKTRIYLTFLIID